MSTFFINRCSPALLKRLSFSRAQFAPCGKWLRGLCALAVAVLVASQGVAPVRAASSTKEKTTSKDSGPVLMSRTGGGNMWANVKELEAAVANGNPRAEAQLGEMLLRGDRIAKDERRGVALLEKAARSGNSTAAFRIGMLLMNGDAGVAKDPPRALAYFRAAAAGGEKEAFFNIGAAYGSAKGVKRDYGEALGWLIIARQRGADPQAESDLRARIKAQPTWVARGERRAKEIEQEFVGKKVADFLPPEASLAVPASNTPELRPGASASPAPAKPAIDLQPPPSKTDDSLKPSLPSLPPPTIPRP